jgi:hypothetical protein
MPNKTYTTIAGDTWDIIAFNIWGDEFKMTDLQKANPDYLHVVMFDADVVLNVPEVETAAASMVAPWNR